MTALKTSPSLVQQDDAVTGPHSQDSSDVLGLCTGYRKRALAAKVFVNEKATHEKPHGVLGVLE